MTQCRRATHSFGLLGLTALIVMGNTGCSSNGFSDDIPRTFKTRITSSNLKHFELRFAAPKSSPAEIMARQSRDPNVRRQNRKRRDPEQIEKMLKEEAQNYVDNTNFCRTGFWVLDRGIYQKNMYIRGECNELATDEDRKKFPDTLEYW